MANYEWQMQQINWIGRTLRLEEKVRENADKPPLVSPDVVETKDFVFSTFQPHESEGDSGALLIAKKKLDRNYRYVVKHEYTDCAANEYVYTKLAQAIDMKMPEAVLFRLSEGEKRKYWKTEYIIGSRYLPNATVPSREEIKVVAKNPDDLYRFFAMERLCCEADGIEYLLSEDGYLYRIDTTASFILGDPFFFDAGVNMEFYGQPPKKRVMDYVSQIDYEAHLSVESFEKDLKYHVERYGNECKEIYLDTHRRIQEISTEYIDEFLNTLCYFYPDFIGDYFKSYITTMQKQSAKFLKSQGDY